MRIKYIDLVLENCDVVRLEPKDVSRFHIDEITEGIGYYGEYSDGSQHISRTKRCNFLGISISKPKEIVQQCLGYEESTNAYDMIINHSDITAIDLIYSDDTNEYIYVDFNEYNDNYNINQNNEFYNNILEVTISEDNSIEEDEHEEYE